MELFRCSVCGKWSHAQKKPKTHQRWVVEGSKEFNKSLGEGPVYDYQGSLLKSDGHFVTCGPFDTYIAFTESELKDTFSDVFNLTA